MTDPSSGTAAFLPDAGWYPDPVSPGIWRWWDGVEWTKHTHRPEGPHTQPSPSMPQPAAQQRSVAPPAAASVAVPPLTEARALPTLPAVTGPVSTPTSTSPAVQHAAFRGRGSSLEAARAARTQTVELRKPNPVTIVSLVFGIVALLAPVVIFALVAIFTGLFGLRRAAESFPPVGRGAATAGIVLGIISLLLTAIASMIAMADPAIRAIVLGAI